MAFNWEWNVERRAGRGHSLKSEECYFFSFSFFFLHPGYFSRTSPFIAVSSSVNKVCPQGPEAMRSDWDPLLSEIFPGMVLWHCRRSPSPTEDCGWRPWMARSRWGTQPAFPGKWPVAVVCAMAFWGFFLTFFLTFSSRVLAPSSGGTRSFIRNYDLNSPAYAKNRMVHRKWLHNK